MRFKQFLNENSDKIKQIKNEIKQLRDGMEERLHLCRNASERASVKHSIKLNIDKLREQLALLQKPKEKTSIDNMSAAEFAKYALQKHDNNYIKALRYIKNRKTSPEDWRRNADAWDILNNQHGVR